MGGRKILERGAGKLLRSGNVICLVEGVCIAGMQKDRDFTCFALLYATSPLSEITWSLVKCFVDMVYMVAFGVERE